MRVVFRNAAAAAVLVAAIAACSHTSGAAPDGGTDPSSDAAPPVGDAAEAGPTGCAAGAAGAACVLDLYDRAAASCAAMDLAALHGELDAHANLGPLWSAQRALFRTAAPAQIAGTFDNWSTSAIATAALCGDTTLIVGAGAVATGFHTYKLETAGAWSLDPTNPAFAYDDFAGNADHRNSVLDTPDSGLGHLVTLGDACSTSLGNCRTITAYLPPGYDAPAAAARTYPVLFMHDGQNVWDDHTCCFGHTGWEINVTLDTEIAAGRVAPVVVIAADNTTARNDEYGLTPATMDLFMDFQVHTLQPMALAKVRGDGARVAIAGSSLGGLVSMQLALRYPDTYSAAASLSGAFWPGMDTHVALRDEIPGLGKQPLAIYIDHGGQPSDDSDGAADSIEVRDLLVARGWTQETSPACTRGDDALCYHWEPDATHDELAWKARAWRFLRYLFPVATP